MRTNSTGEWIKTWESISFRCQGDQPVWKKSIVFGGVTHEAQREKLFVRLLYFSEPTGVVDLTDSITQIAFGGRGFDITWIRLKQRDGEIDVNMIPTLGPEFTRRVSFEQLAELARIVAAQGKKSAIEGIEFFE